MRHLLFSALLLAQIGHLQASDTLTVAQCRALAVQNSPLQQKKALAESIAALQTRDLESNNLPRINVGGQATWQSDVFGLPIKFPGVSIPKVPKDQYKLTLDANERIWDGNLDRTLKQQRNLERDISLAQTEVDAFQLRELVTDLFCKILLLQETEEVLLSAQTDLENRLKQAEASIREGVALRTTADQIRIQMFKNDQQLVSTRADQKTLMELLALWIGRAQPDFALAAPTNKTALPMGIADAPRPEYRLFTLQQQNLMLNKDLLRQKLQPRLDVFAQTGLGRPNPFNFFASGFDPFLLLGIKASWTPIDWGNRKRDAQVLDLQARNIDVQKVAFDQRLRANLLKDQEDALKYQSLLKQDDQIIALQTDIVQRADAQVKNGVMTATDYLTQLNILTQSQLTKKTHEVQGLQARELALAKRGE
ncbi:MAG: TolC family protein [Bacteroidota bacterium]